jgi:hypothetical protein
MELILLIGSLILLALAALRWGHDSRRLLDHGRWLGEPEPEEAEVAPEARPT